jgi:hypothetical protein
MFRPSKKYPSRDTVPLKATDQGIKITSIQRRILFLNLLKAKAISGILNLTLKDSILPK